MDACKDDACTLEVEGGIRRAALVAFLFCELCLLGRLTLIQNCDGGHFSTG